MPLSPRELQVLNLIAEGCTNKEIAARLNLAERTAKYHVTAVFNKLGAATRAQATAFGTQRGLI
jgi:DNA-binding NarL/FixJ family response regulator